MSHPSLRLLVAAVMLVGCSGNTAARATGTAATAMPSVAATTSTTSTFKAEVWVDNWFSLVVNGAAVGEDSVPITTERSFNAETLTFTASYPLTIAFVTKDYKETDSGLEYIGTDRQQMGDGGFIAQITDISTGVVVAATNSGWRSLVVQRSPLNQDCVASAAPNTDCRSEAIDEPARWTEPTFDDSAWLPASTYSEAQVGTKGGYETITWNRAATLIWSSDLKIDNTVLWRYVVKAAIGRLPCRPDC
jgi:hypothetical protein